MPADLISKKTRTVLRELLVGTTVGFIDDEFQAAGLTPDAGFEPPLSGARRSRVEQYYHAMNFSREEDAGRFLQICESLLHGGRDRFAGVLTWIERDGYKLEDGKFRQITDPSIADELRNHVTNLPHLRRLLERMERSIERDPELAIGTSKELVEAIAKTVLADRGVKVEATWDLPELLKRMRTELALMPDGVPAAAKGREVIKRILISLGSVVQGLAELRGLYGSGHGRDGRTSGLRPRHARLATAAAGALATFFLETHLEKGGSGAGGSISDSATRHDLQK